MQSTKLEIDCYTAPMKHFAAWKIAEANAFGLAVIFLNLVSTKLC